MENFQHDSHQFYFERYLRNKLSADERAKLEAKLNENQELQAAFQEYKLNRKAFLKELISEHDKGPRKSKLANTFYLIISIIGIFTALNFYFENQSLREEREQNKNLISRLIEHIPFVGSKGKGESVSSSKNKANTSKSTQNNNTNTTVTKTENKTIEVENDILLDTVLVPILRNFYEEKSAYFKTEIDSSLTDNDIQQMILKNAGKYDIKYKSNPIAVIMERSSQSKNSYTFDGLKLTISGQHLPNHLLLVNDQGELVWLNGNQEVLLIADNQPHNY